MRMLAIKRMAVTIELVPVTLVGLKTRPSFIYFPLRRN
jgi:hypothetical protein